jgi:hypothetical protein
MSKDEWVRLIHTLLIVLIAWAIGSFILYILAEKGLYVLKKLGELLSDRALAMSK